MPKKIIIEFKFVLYQNVVTPFGEKGIVDTLALDDGGVKYFVKTANGGSWFPEHLLSEA